MGEKKSKMFCIFVYFPHKRAMKMWSNNGEKLFYSHHVPVSAQCSNISVFLFVFHLIDVTFSRRNAVDRWASDYFINSLTRCCDGEFCRNRACSTHIFAPSYIHLAGLIEYGCTLFVRCHLHYTTSFADSILIPRISRKLTSYMNIIIIISFSLILSLSLCFSITHFFSVYTLQFFVHSHIGGIMAECKHSLSLYDFHSYGIIETVT